MNRFTFLPTPITVLFRSQGGVLSRRTHVSDHGCPDRASMPKWVEQWYFKAFKIPDISGDDGELMNRPGFCGGSNI